MDLAALVAEALVEDAPLVAARQRATDLGVRSATPETGSLLSTLAALVGARTAVETGTGTGVSGLWIVRGMRADGTLTSIDINADHQRIARETFVHAEVTGARYRLIAGDALEVLPRLTDRGYDLVHLDAQPGSYPEQLEQARRLLRPGGVLVVSGVLSGPRTSREPGAVGGRAVLTQITAWEAEGSARAAVLPVGDGVLVMTPTG